MLGLVRFLPKFGWQPIVVAPEVPWEPHDPSLSRGAARAPIERVPFASGISGRLVRHIAPKLTGFTRPGPRASA